MPYNYDTRTITHNTSYGLYSTISRDASTNTVTFGAPVEITGLKSVKIDTKQDFEDVYADGVVHLTKAGAEQVTGELSTLQINQLFWKDLLGREVVTIEGSKSVSLTDGGTRNNFVFVFAEDLTDEFGQTVTTWRVFTNVKAAVPSTESGTDEDKITEVTYTVPLTFSVNSAVKNKAGKSMREAMVIDGDGSIKTKVDAMFGETPTVTMEDFLQLVMGTAGAA